MFLNPQPLCLGKPAYGPALRPSFLLRRTPLSAQSTTPTRLSGTAPLDNQKLIGNAPPAGEQLYSGFTSPGAKLPHSPTEMAPINANLPLQYVAGVPATYYYPDRTIFGFSYGGYGGGDGPVLMPVVGDWALPPQRTPSVYDKNRETASPGYYSVFLNDFDVQAEMTATLWTGLYRFTFPATEAAHILLDTDRGGGTIEVVGDSTVRGVIQHRGRRNHGVDQEYFIAEFSRPFQSFRRLQRDPSHPVAVSRLSAGRQRTWSPAPAP